MVDRERQVVDSGDGSETLGRRSTISKVVGFDEMRRLLGVMRAPVDAAELAPQPGFDQLNALIEEHRRFGVRCASVFVARWPSCPWRSS